MFGLNGALFGIWASRIPAIVEKLSLSHQMVGILLLFMASGAIVAFPLAGHFSDKFGAFRTTKVSAAFYLLALILLSLANSPIVLAMALFVFGATHGAMDVAMNSWATEVEKANQAPQMSSFHAMFSLGAGLGAATGFAAVQLGLSPFIHFTSASIVIGAFAFIVARINWVSTTHSPQQKPPLFAIPKGPMLLVGIVAFCSAIGEGSMADWSALFLQAAAGATEANAAIGYTIFSIGMVMVRLLGSVIIGKFGRTTTVRLGGTSALIGSLAAVLSGNYGVALFGFAAMGAGYALIIPIAFSKAAELAPKSPGVAIASVSTLGYGGLLLGPPLIGFVAGLVTLRVAFVVVAGLAALLVLSAGAMDRGK